MVTALQSRNFNVQLKHNPAEVGTFRDDHGFVRLIGENGNVLAENSCFQHNRNFSNRSAVALELAEEASMEFAKDLNVGCNATNKVAASS